MPIYEYKCSACDHTFEQIQRVSDPAPTKCPSCGKKKIKRVISSGTSFILKGGGWHQPGHN